MKKKNVLTAALALSVAAILAVGGSLAYFTDKDAKENVFTVGDVEIQLDENYEEDSKLYPGAEKDAVTKEVDVTNIGSENAYVRVHIAVPSALDANGYIHLLRNESSWAWEAGTYTTKIGDLNYNVYVATYQEALAAEEQTKEHALNSVYMDKKVTNEIIKELEKAGVITATQPDAQRRLNIQVMAEGVQEAGFETAGAAAAFEAALPYSADSNPFIGYKAIN
ncbi:MAG: TasA family protein [Lachnospiraceae bacterium]|nr:TasA family protein [Lachnospiraceae bacterium]